MQVGTDGTGHRILQQLGHTLHPTYPALTPLTGPHPGGHQLAGLSLYAVDMSIQAPGVKKARRAMRSGLLFTHKGYRCGCWVACDLYHGVVVGAACVCRSRCPTSAALCAKREREL